MLTRSIVQLLLLLLPWRARRWLLCRLLGYDIHPTATIGLSIIAPSKRLVMRGGARIGHLNLARGMDSIELGEGASISHLNWIYGIPSHASYLQHEAGRRSELVLEEGAGITRRHLVDCSNTVRVGRYALIAGYSTQILTHAIDLHEGRQGTRRVVIGEASMVGTRCLVLGGAVLPAFSALGAGSTLRSAFEETHRIYSGVPAKAVADVPRDAKFFKRGYQ